MRIGVLDYGMGNLGSVSYALSRIGSKSSIVSQAEGIDGCSALILPGVGSFGPAMGRLESFREPLAKFVRSGRPLLGICLGMQVLFERGTENGSYDGLGLLEGSVTKLAKAPKLPQVGWNTVEFARSSRLMAGLRDGDYFYFVHSYACRPDSPDAVVCTTGYGTKFASVVEKGNVFGTQFHPEKSGAAGELLLRNFVGLAGKCR